MMIIGAILITVAPIPFGAQVAAQGALAPSEVWVDASYAGLHDGDLTPGGHVFGVNATDTINNGSDMVADNGLVHVAAGTYNENVVIDHPLVLSGANAGVSANGARGDESIVNGSSGTGIMINANHVTLDGFTITGFTQMVINSTGDNVKIANNVIDGYAGYVDNPVNGTGSNAVLINNKFYWDGGWEALIWYGDNANISGNVMSLPVGPTSTAITPLRQSGFIFNQGNGSVITNNIIDFPTWWAPGSIQAFGDDLTVSGNNVSIGEADPFMIDVEGNRSNVDNNILKAKLVDDAVIRVNGDHATISKNDEEIATLGASDDNGFGAQVLGDFAQVTGNTFNVTKS